MTRLNVAEAAGELKYTEYTVRLKLRTGELHGTKKGQWRVKAECLEAFQDGRICADRQNVTPLQRRKRA